MNRITDIPSSRTKISYVWHKDRRAAPVPPAVALVEPRSPAQLGEFVISKERATQMHRQSGLSLEDFLMSLVPAAAKLARPPVSKFQVGWVAGEAYARRLALHKLRSEGPGAAKLAVGLGASGNIYLGVNIEIAGVPLSQSVHAEQCLLTNLLLHDERGVQLVAISEAPCGHCRQFYSELACADSVQFVFGSARTKHPLDELLPRRFGPHDLITGGQFPLLLEPQHNDVALTAAAQRVVVARADDALFQQAVHLAVSSAQQSYCPYTKLPSGVVLVTESGEMFGGRYIESAAYNPSLPPLQSALAAAVIQGLPDYSQVCQVVLVECSRSLVQQRGIVKAVARSLFPNADVMVLGISTGRKR